MAVNTQKLLPAAKGSPLAKISAAKITKITSIKTKKIDTQKLLGSAKEDSPENIKETLLNIDSLLKSILGEEKKNQSKKRKEKERKDFEEQEKKLEAPKEAKKFKLPGLAVPGMSFLDRIKRFLFFTALGWLFTKFQDQLPKLEGIVKTIAQVYVVAEGIFKSLLGGLVNFIDIGYQTYDGLRKQVENIGGKDAVKTFDEFSGHLNKLINGAIMASMLIISTAPKRPKIPTGGTSSALGASAKAASAYSQTAAGKSYAAMQQFRNLPKWAQSISASSAGRFSASQSRIIAGTANIGDKLRVGTRGFVPGIGQIAERIGTKGTTKVAGSVAKGAKFGGGRIPIIGPLVTFLVRRYVYGEKPEKAAAAAIGTGIGQAIGGFIGTIGAGALGLGTAGLGAVVAPLIVGAGSVIGGLVGEWLGALLYDFVVGSEVPKPQLKAAGGPVTRGGKRQGGPSRTLKITRRRPPKVKPKQSQPGKDVGGKKNIQKLYPDPSARTEIEGPQQSPWFSSLPTDPTKRDQKLKSLPNPYKALTGVAKKLKDIPFGIGALMGGAVDIALGEKLPKNAIDNLGNGIAYLINAIATQQVSASITGIEKEISKMQSGGVVPRLRDFSKQDQVGSDVTKVLNGLIRQKVDEAIKEVQKQMMPGKYSGSATGGTPPGTTPPGTTPPGPAGPVPSGPITTVPGIVDRLGRPVRFAKSAAEAFILMMEDAKKEKKPFKGSDIESTYRDPQLNRDVGGATNSKHLYGLAADIHGTTGAWIRSKGRDYGWIPYDYEGTHGGHYEYVGGGKKEKPLATLPDIFQQKPKQQPGQLSPIFQLPGGQSPGQQPKAKKSYNGLTSFYGTSGSEPEKPPRDGFGYDPDKKTTSSGQPFIPSGLTAAHKTLPFGTKLRVTNPNNGKSVVVTVNDRGPYSGNRVLDLSYGAARAIGMVGSGEINAKIEELKGGGYVPKQAPNKNLSSLRSYPSYSEGGVMIAIQPMIIEKPVPMPTGGSKTIMFPVPVGVNNSNMQSLSRG